MRASVVEPGWVAAALLAAGAAALLVPPRVSVGSEDRSRSGWGRRSLAVVAVLTLLMAWTALTVHDFLLLGTAVLVALGVTRIVRRQRAATAADRRAEQVLALCESMASDLEAGQPPSTCLERAGAEWPEFAAVATASRMGADVPQVLRELATRPGAAQLRTVAATWQVAHETGTGLARALSQAAAAIRGDRRIARLVSSELAAARATARMLAVLPLAVLLMGTGLGGDPVGFLVGTTPGLVLLATGLGLSYLGLVWLERIADRVLGR